MDRRRGGRSGGGEAGSCRDGRLGVRTAACRSGDVEVDRPAVLSDNHSPLGASFPRTGDVGARMGPGQGLGSRSRSVGRVGA